MTAPREHDTVEVPLIVRLHFCRAALQTIADGLGVNLLHIKGDAVSPVLRPGTLVGTDVDVMVQPAHLALLHRALVASGWQIYSSFEAGSPFGHAQTYAHPVWGYLDLHRSFPGIGLEPDAAFDRLWRDRRSMPFAGVECPVPSVSAQGAILVLNAARAGGGRDRDLGPAWYDASDELRAGVAAEIDGLDARLAFDAALGRIEGHRGERGYRLWKVTVEGGGRAEEWWARIEAAPTLGARARLIVLAPLVNVSHLEHRLGRPPTSTEILREFVDRPSRAVRELVAQLRRTATRRTRR